ncbi:MAG: hypothetical protein ACYC5X_14385 [Syntrophales bacterium]
MPVVIPIVDRSPIGLIPTVLRKCWDELLAAVYGVEDLSGYPVDCEFTIDQYGILYLLQSRPVAALTAYKDKPLLLPIASSSPLPSVLISHPKVSLRLRCEREGIDISRGWIVTQTAWTKVAPFGFPLGCYTSVLVYPKLLQGKVRRQFSADGYSGASLLLAESCDYWVRHVFVAEVIDPVGTGVACRHKGHFIIEVAKGHFVPKGVVDTTVYELHNNEIVLVKQPLQKWFFGIDPLTGGAIRHEWSGMPGLTDEQIKNVGKILEMLNLKDGDILEFGVDLNQKIYVIDIQTTSDSNTELIVTSRVVSTGQCEGELIIWEGDASDSTSTHFFEFSFDATSKNPVFHPVVVAAERPDITLISFLMGLAKNGKRVVGMIFRIYSPLCHLSLLLREAGVPAIVIEDFEPHGLTAGAWVRIEATASDGQVFTMSPKLNNTI